MHSLIKCLFLDLDLTLVDNARQVYISYIKELSNYLYGVNNRSLDHVLSFQDFIKIYYIDPEYSYLIENSRLYNLYTNLRQKILSNNKFFWRNVWYRYIMDGVYGKPMECSRSFLDYASGRYMTLITTGREIESRYIRAELELYGFTSKMHKLYSAGDLRYNATKLDLYNHVFKEISRFSIKPQNIVVISDSPRDLRFARGFGFNTIGIVNNYNKHVVSILRDQSSLPISNSLCGLVDRLDDFIDH